MDTDTIEDLLRYNGLDESGINPSNISKTTSAIDNHQKVLIVGSGHSNIDTRHLITSHAHLGKIPLISHEERMLDEKELADNFIKQASQTYRPGFSSMLASMIAIGSFAGGGFGIDHRERNPTYEQTRIKKPLKCDRPSCTKMTFNKYCSSECAKLHKKEKKELHEANRISKHNKEIGNGN